MALIFRTSNTANIGTSYIKSSPLTYTEGDGNLAWLATNMSGSIISITGSSSMQGSLTVSAGITGSLFGTASWARNVLTASYLSGSVSNAVTSSYPISVSGSTIYSTGPSSVAGFSTNNSIFLGDNAGRNARSAYNSTFIGQNAGSGSTDAYNSNFLGVSAGRSAASASNSNFLGLQAGYLAANANLSNFLGYQAGNGAINANNSNFLGGSAGQDATSAQYSNFIGQNAGINATGAANSNFLGAGAGSNAATAYDSNFIGYVAGQDATNAYHSHFIGSSAGQTATNANNSNFIGQSAGTNATDAAYSNFLGASAGQDAANANNSNFLGVNAGNGATNAANSNFLGYNAGHIAPNASYSTLIGYQVGYNASSTGVGSNNIIIGTNISLPDDTQDSINIGGIIFGTGSYSTTTGDPYLGSQAGIGRVGINVVSPNHTLDVSGSINASSTIYANNLAGVVFNTASLGYVRLIGDNDGTGLDGGDYILRTGLIYYGDIITDNYLAYQGTLSGSFARVGIGTIYPSYRLELSQDSAAKPSTNTWTITSDSRVKENVQPYTKGLDVINQINPVTYDYNGKAGFQKIKGNVGIIAQDVKDLLPESISTYFKKLDETDTAETELYNFNSHALTYVLINAIKELKAEIDLLKSQM